MCGFTAIVGDSKNLYKSREMLNYRGLPKRYSEYHTKDISIAHTRLPIVDLSVAGEQPACIGKHIGFLVGEVFNFKEFSTANTDTKACLEVFIKEGLEGFHKFDGFWSFITVHEGKLLAATDYLSQKPIYYRTDMKAIASEPAALLAYGKAYPDPLFYSNIQKWGYDMTGNTPWEQIKQLPAGHYWYDGDIKPYWNWNKIEPGFIRSVLTTAVANRLLGDQPIACLLSGGLDSSIVYLLAKELGANLTSFHVENDEVEYAKLVDPNTKALELHSVSYKDALTWHQSPVDLGSVHPQAVLAQAVASEDYYVCLTGDGADELFGGYGRAERYDSQMSDVFMELPYYHLPRLDRLMMRHTLELRTPFLSPRVIATAINTPYEDRIHKKLLKDFFCDLVPDQILNRPKKPLKTEAVELGGVEKIKQNINIFKGINYDPTNL